MFSVTKGIAGRSLIIKAKEPNLKAFGLNGSLIKFFNLPGFENYASIEKEYFETIEVNNVSNPKNYFINCDLIDKQQSLLNDNQDKSIGHKVVFIDKPLPPQKVHPREVNMKFYKHAFRRLVCQKPGGEDAVTDDDTERNTKPTAKTSERLHSTGIDLEIQNSLRVDELSINDILQQGAGFHPAQGMKMVFQVFQALKRLPEAKFIFSHKSGEIHGCLYKSIVPTSGALKSSYDLHKAGTPVVVNFTEAEIPWVAIDCNLFMPWQIRERRIPCTFPPVPAKDLEMMNKKAQEAATKGSNKNKKKKKKGKKKGKAKGSEPKLTSAGPATDQLKTPRKERRTVNKGKLFASFYDTQPAEKESEVFAVSRRASGPVSYDDIDF
ncbi:hypothetical protein ACROYT_G024065 [Oculina patagonica]